MSFNLSQLDIIPTVYDHIYEPNEITIGIESTLINIAIMLGRAGIDLENLKEHFTTATKHGLERSPTLVMVTDTRRQNELDYLTGTLTISQTETGKPHIAVGVRQYSNLRVYDLDTGWINNWGIKHCEIHLTVDDPEKSHLEVSGADFTPEDFSNGTLAGFVQMLGEELKEAITSLKPFTYDISENDYRLTVLKALGGNTVSDTANPEIKYNAPWSLVGWDSGVEFKDLMTRFHNPVLILG